MDFSSIGRARGAALVCSMLLTLAPDISAAKACKCLHKHVTTGPGPVQIETCLLGYRERGTRTKRVTHVRQVMRNVGDRALTLHFSDERYNFNPIVAINGVQRGCGDFENVLGGIMKAIPTDGGPPPTPWVPSQQILEPGARFTKQFPITRFFECAPSAQDSHYVDVRTDHEYLLAGDKICVLGEQSCHIARVQSRDGGAKFPDVRLASMNEGAPQCVVK